MSNYTLRAGRALISAPRRQFSLAASEAVQRTRGPPSILGGRRRRHRRLPQLACIFSRIFALIKWWLTAGAEREMISNAARIFFTPANGAYLSTPRAAGEKSGGRRRRQLAAIVNPKVSGDREHCRVEHVAYIRQQQALLEKSLLPPRYVNAQRSCSDKNWWKVRFKILFARFK